MLWCDVLMRGYARSLVWCTEKGSKQHGHFRCLSLSIKRTCCWAGMGRSKPNIIARFITSNYELTEFSPCKTSDKWAKFYSGLEASNILRTHYKKDAQNWLSIASHLQDLLFSLDFPIKKPVCTCAKSKSHCYDNQSDTSIFHTQVHLDTFTSYISQPVLSLPSKAL